MSSSFIEIDMIAGVVVRGAEAEEREMAHAKRRAEGFCLLLSLFHSPLIFSWRGISRKIKFKQSSFRDTVSIRATSLHELQASRYFAIEAKETKREDDEEDLYSLLSS